jgi:hypothetical protein
LVENLSKLLQKFLDAQYKYLILQVNIGGGAGIRTLGGIAPTTIFETVPFNRSGTPPCWAYNWLRTLPNL